MRNLNSRIPACSVVLLTLLSNSPVQAGNVLQAFEPRTLEPGDVLEQPIEWTRDSGVRLEIRLVEPPSGARLVVNTTGKLFLQWESDFDMQAETSLVVQARDVDTGSVVDTSVLVVRKAPVANQSASSEPTVPSIPPPVVTLKPLPGQIVSAGRVVSIRVEGISSDDLTPVISIDRVPRNGSFEKNSQGSYTFYWQTSDRDQGEHVFRVTASHPSKEAAVTSRELTIVVGDPSRGRTSPSETSDNGS